MKTVLIPGDYNPFVLNINGVIYSYKAGTTQTVPDEIADLIENIESLKPNEKKPTADGYVWTADGNGNAEWRPLPAMPGASETAIGGVKKGNAVADATDADDVVATVNALIASLVGSGALKQYVAPETE